VKRNKLLVLLIGICLVVVLAALPFMSACSPAGPGEQEEEEEEEEEAKTVTIGVAGSFTGAYAPYGSPMRDSIRLAVKMVNEGCLQYPGIGFMVDGQRYIIETVEYDNRNDPKRSAAGITMLKDVHDIDMIIGSFSSQCTLASQPIAEERHILQINAGASVMVTRPGLKWSWSLAQSTDHRALATVPYLANVMEAKSVAMITENEAFCMSGHDSFKAEFEKAGMEIVEDVVYESDVKDFSTIIARCKQYDPDVLFVNGVSGNNILIVKQVYEAGWPVQLSGQVDLPTDDLFRVTGKAADGIVAMGRFDYWAYKEGKVPEKVIELMGTNMDWYYDMAENYRSEYGDEKMALSNIGMRWVSAFVECMMGAGTVDDEMKLRDYFDGMEWNDSTQNNKMLANHRQRTYIPIVVYYESTVGADKSDILGLSYHTDDMQENWVSEKIMDYKTIAELRAERGY